MKTSMTAMTLVFVIAAAAQAQTADGALAEAMAAAKAGKNDEAAKAFGRAAAVAQKANDLFAEQRMAKELWSFLEGQADRPDALAAVLGSLDTKRAGAFVSARAIGGELILHATKSGDTKHVGEAAKALAAQATMAKCGKATRVLLAYAKAMEVVAATKGADARDALGKVLADAVLEGWCDVGLHAGTELAVQSLKCGKDSEAKNALATVATLFTPGTDPDLAQTWRGVVKRRLADATPETLAPFEAAMKPFAGGMSSSAAGGAGGAGGSPGPTKLGKAWNKLSPTQTFVSVKRLDDGFEITGAFDLELKARQKLEHGLCHRTEGGVTLSFCGRGVALRKLDLEAGEGQPGATSFLPAGIPLYRLAKGETLTLSKQGLVSISGS